MKICIITDDNSGFTKDEANKLGIKILRMPIIINGECYFENETLNSDLFYKYLEEDKDVKTSQPSPGEVINLWDETLKSYDAIIHMPMSSGLSESCHSALMLAEDYKDKVFVVDNHRISITLKRAVYDALNLIKLGKNPAEIKDFLENTKSESVIYIMVDTLKYLKKGGRVTPAAAALGTLLRLKPVLQIQGEKLDAFAKARTVKQAKTMMINAVKKDLEERFSNYCEEGTMMLAIAHTDNEEAAQEFKKEVEEAIPGYEIYVDKLSLSISCHIGPGSLALAATKKVK